ncbi:hypothetical protein JX266_003185 [Neoarthrinium moseri]|nr:hypothetical protein JX266_003185 [Neoarthrinium moseri]
MSKRSFSDYSSESISQDAISQIVQQAEDLLRAARVLKDGLDNGKRQDENAVERLREINNRLSPAINELGKPSMVSSHKLPKLDKSPDILIPSTAALTPWSPEDLASPRPILPPVLDPALERAAFTHQGMVSQGEQSYERLEWIGDAYLYLMSSAFIYQSFPKLPAGRCSQYRELLVRNKTLSQYTSDYHMQRRLRFPPEFDPTNNAGGTLMADKQKKKILGDIFESYVAAAILSDPAQGLSQVSSWMKALWAEELKEELSSEFRRRAQAPTQPANGESAGQPAQDLYPKVVLSRTIGAPGVRIEYRDEGKPGTEKKTGLPWYTIGVYLDGWGVKNYKMGYGGALSKKEAGQKAAQSALNNKQMIEKFAQKKKDFSATMEAQREYAEWKA